MNPVSVSAVLDKVLKDARTRVQPSTLRKYRHAARVIRDQIGGKKIDVISPAVIFALLDSRRATPAAANHMHTLLRLIGRYATLAGLIPGNPVLDIPRFRQQPRDRYITDREFAEIRSAARPALLIAIDLAYLTAQRIGDVLSINNDQVIDGKAISFKQQKTGIRVIVSAPGLEEVITHARRHSPVNSTWLLSNRLGLPYEYQQIYGWWRQACARARVEDAHIHDIRAKSVTDAERQGLDPTALAGHTNTAQTRRYLRGRAAKNVCGPDNL